MLYVHNSGWSISCHDNIYPHSRLADRFQQKFRGVEGWTANAAHSHNVGWMLNQRLWCVANIEPEFIQWSCFPGGHVGFIACEPVLHPVNWLLPCQQTRYIEPMLVHCWPAVIDGGLTVNQHWCLLGCTLLPPSHTRPESDMGTWTVVRREDWLVRGLYECRR